METENEKALWKMAKKRVEFKRHLSTYLVVNGLFWILWFFTESPTERANSLPWPVWPMLGWGIGVLFDYMGSYSNPKGTAIQKEYDKLKNNM